MSDINESSIRKMPGFALPSGSLTFNSTLRQMNNAYKAIGRPLWPQGLARQNELLKYKDVKSDGFQNYISK